MGSPDRLGDVPIDRLLVKGEIGVRQEGAERVQSHVVGERRPELGQRSNPAFRPHAAGGECNARAISEWSPRDDLQDHAAPGLQAALVASTNRHADGNRRPPRGVG